MPSVKVTLLTLLICIIFYQAFSQDKLRSCLAKDIKAGSQEQLDSLTEELLTNIDKGRFYFLGESHSILANNDLQLVLIRQLHKQGIYNIVNELPHAECFIFNEYLETGNDSLFSKFWPQASYRVLKEVRAFNASLPHSQRIRYYGIDHLDPAFDFSNLAISLRIIRDKIPDQGTTVDKLIDDYIRTAKHVAANVKVFNEELAKALVVDSVKYKKQFNRYYHDLLLMAHNIIGYRANRDKDVYACFKVLYNSLLQQGHARPGFLAFYGIGHIANLGGMLQDDKDSPVQNEVIKIGLQYFRCLGGWPVQPERYLDSGVDYIFPKSEIAVLRSLFFGNNWTVGVIPGWSCLKSPKRKHNLDGLIVFKEYGTRRMRSWKFD